MELTNQPPQPDLQNPELGLPHLKKLFVTIPMVGVLILFVVFSVGAYWLGRQSVINKIIPLPKTYIPQPSNMISQSPITTITSTNKIDNNIIQTLRNKGEVLVIVQTNPLQELINQNDEINKYKTSNDAILADIKRETGGQGYLIYGRWDSLGSFALKISTEKALHAVENHSHVKSLQEDEPVGITTNTTTCSKDADCQTYGAGAACPDGQNCNLSNRYGKCINSSCENDYNNWPLVQTCFGGPEQNFADWKTVHTLSNTYPGIYIWRNSKTGDVFKGTENNCE